MSVKLSLVAKLKALCEREGGVDAVSIATGLSAESLKQVLAGTKLPSGNPRGLGPKSLDAIEAAYPGWMDSTRAPVTDALKAWPFRRMTAEQWVALDDYDRVLVEDAAASKLRELLAARPVPAPSGPRLAHTYPAGDDSPIAGTVDIDAEVRASRTGKKNERHKN